MSIISSSSLASPWCSLAEDLGHVVAVELHQACPRPWRRSGRSRGLRAAGGAGPRSPRARTSSTARRRAPPWPSPPGPSRRRRRSCRRTSGGRRRSPCGRSPIISAISVSGSGTAISSTKSQWPRPATASMAGRGDLEEGALEVGHRARREAPVDQPAQQGVARLGLVDESDLRRQAGPHAVGRGEELLVLRDVGDVLVAGGDPEPVGARTSARGRSRAASGNAPACARPSSPGPDRKRRRPWGAPLAALSAGPHPYRQGTGSPRAGRESASGARAPLRRAGPRRAPPDRARRW